MQVVLVKCKIEPVADRCAQCEHIERSEFDALQPFCNLFKKPLTGKMHGNYIRCPECLTAETKTNIETLEFDRVCDGLTELALDKMSKSDMLDKAKEIVGHADNIDAFDLDNIDGTYCPHPNYIIIKGKRGMLVLQCAKCREMLKCETMTEKEWKTDILTKTFSEKA